jgi:hypothetical protein
MRQVKEESKAPLAGERAVAAVRHAPRGSPRRLKIGRVPSTGVREGNALNFRHGEPI